MTEETYPEAAAILRDAGWAPHDAWQVYTRDTLVMGFQPDGQGFHVKNWAKVQPGDRAYSEDTPDTAEEAAAWLVERFKPVAVLSEAEETAAHESDSETGEEPSGKSAPDGVVLEGSDAGDAVGVDLSDAAIGLSDVGRADGGSEAGDDEALGSLARTSVDADPIDADFEETPDLGAELLDDEDFTLPELPAPEPEDFAPDEIEPEDHSPGAFIFGDNLAHDRIVRIGQLSERATELIAEAKVGYSDAEHDAVRSHVVTHMNAAGAYVGDNPKLFGRFIELETVTARIRRIEIYRDERQDFIRSADREAVASFDPAAGWP